MSPGITPSITSSWISSTSSGGPDPTETDAGGLSTGAKIGIGLGVSLPIVIIALIGVCFILFHKKGKKKQQQEQPPPSYPQQAPVVVNNPSPNMHESQPFLGAAGAYSPHKSPAYPDVQPAPMAENQGYVGADHQDHELRKIQERRDRLLELERLEQEEARLMARTSQVSGARSPTSAVSELPDPNSQNVQVPYEMPAVPASPRAHN